MPCLRYVEVRRLDNHHTAGHVTPGVEKWPAEPNTAGFAGIGEVGFARGEAQRERIFLVDGGDDEQHDEIPR